MCLKCLPQQWVPPHQSKSVLGVTRSESISNQHRNPGSNSLGKQCGTCEVGCHTKEDYFSISPSAGHCRWFRASTGDTTDRKIGFLDERQHTGCVRNVMMDGCDARQRGFGSQKFCFVAINQDHFRSTTLPGRGSSQ
jgi:hypothetical protein